MKLLTVFIIAINFYALQAVAQEEVPAGSALQCEEAITVFQDVSMIGRKDRASKNITKMHIEMAVEGWRFKDMEVYTENGDLEGFFLSYTRPISCSRSTDD